MSTLLVTVRGAPRCSPDAEARAVAEAREVLQTFLPSGAAEMAVHSVAHRGVFLLSVPQNGHLGSGWTATSLYTAVATAIQCGRKAAKTPQQLTPPSLAPGDESEQSNGGVADGGGGAATRDNGQSDPVQFQFCHKLVPVDRELAGTAGPATSAALTAVTTEILVAAGVTAGTTIAVLVVKCGDDSNGTEQMAAREAHPST
jgi:hypothetical protein